jgi:hypothetical protein
VRPQSNNRESQPAAAARRKTEDEATGKVTPVRLTRKFADMIDGVDLTDAKVGDELNLAPHDADVLIAEGWAERARPPRRRADDVQSNASEEAPSRRRSKS